MSSRETGLENEFSGPGESRRPGSDEPGDPETFHALSHIGAEVEFLRASDAGSCLEFSRRADVDLAVLDRCDPATVEAFFAAADPSSRAPAVVVISAEAPEARALDAFRLGASDCVRVGRDYTEVLPLVAMEQIRRWRQWRARDAARSKIEWLERLNEVIVSQIPVALVVLDELGKVVETNPEFERTFGVASDRARGMDIRELLPSDLVESGGLAEAGREQGSPEHGDPRLARMLDEDGRDRVFDIRVQMLDGDGHVLLALSNVTETEFLSRRLGELERFNEHVVESINSALVVTDLDGAITYANPTAGQILGCPPDQLRGRHSEEFFSASEGAPSLLAQALEQGVHSKGGEMMISRAGDPGVPIGISCTPLLDHGGGIRGAVAIFQDLSEIKELQRQVLQQEKMASIGQLAAGIAHEINNPVGFIHANLAQMAEYLDDLSGYLDAVGELRQAVSVGDAAHVDERARALDAVGAEIDIDYLRKDFGSALRESLEGSERIRHIVSDLRDFSHRGGLETTLADINQCVDSTANIVWTMMKHSVELEKDYQDLPQLRCHPMQLKQVFMNLLVNAYQAIEESLREGSEGEGEGGVIRIATRERDGGIEVTIRDTGLGIAASELPRIFDPFYTTKEVGAGTGLGLSTSYGIVKQHGGDMAVTSELGRGSCFEVWLPLEPEPSASVESGTG